MRRDFGILIGLILSIILISGCVQTRGTKPPTETTSLLTETRGWQTYHNDEYDFFLMFPLDWIIESESYSFVILTPSKEKSWQPSTPADIPKDPKVRIDFGEYIRDRMGAAYFPGKVDADTLKTWLEKRVNNGEVKDLSERTIGNFQAFEIMEIYDPGCQRVVYWRPVDLKSLIRVSTGCESPYLSEFDQIVNSVQQME